MSKRVNISIDKELHEYGRKEAEKNGKSFSGWLRGIIYEHAGLSEKKEGVNK